jgi:PAS domain-containing protein
MNQAVVGDLTDIGDSEVRYHAVIDALSEGSVLQNQQDTILASKASAARILRMTPDELHGRTSLDPEWRALRADGSPFPGEEHPAMVTLRTGQPLTKVVMGVRRGEEDPTWISVNTRPLCRAGKQTPNAAVCSFADITCPLCGERPRPGYRDSGCPEALHSVPSSRRVRLTRQGRHRARAGHF